MDSESLIAECEATITELKYLINSGKINPLGAIMLSVKRRRLKVKLRAVKLTNAADSVIVQDCQNELKAIHQKMQWIAPPDWDFHQVKVELYKRIRGDDFKTYGLSEGNGNVE